MCEREWLRVGEKPQPALLSSSAQPPPRPFASDEENKFMAHLYECVCKLCRYLCVCERELYTEKIEERVGERLERDD